MSSTRLFAHASACLPRASTSNLASGTIPAIRSFSSSGATRAESTAFRPKRDETKYGVTGTRIPRSQWPKESETNTDSHPLWKFFHNKESLEVPDKRKDYSSEYQGLFRRSSRARLSAQASENSLGDLVACRSILDLFRVEAQVVRRAPRAVVRSLEGAKRSLDSAGRGEEVEVGFDWFHGCSREVEDGELSLFSLWPHGLL